MKKLVALALSTVLAVSSCVTSAFALDDISENVAQEENVDLAANTSLLAFPGAEGAGKYATGGRGGKIYHVTNLKDSGTGSFRDAVSGSNRIVVFDVGGTIELKSDVVVKDNITIAGQTAPGGKGVTLKNYKIGMGGDNIIARFISSRPGERGTNQDYDAWGGAKGSNSIIDHCSLGWSNDEQWGLYSNNTNYTVQYTIVGPANSFSYHSKGIHGFGIMFGKGQASWHHNLVVHNISRNFRGKVEGTSVMDYVNNVVYDWGYQTAYGTAGRINFANNFYKAGNSTSGAYRYFSFGSGSGIENYKFYLTGNKMLNKDGSVRDDGTKNWSSSFGWSDAATAQGGESYYRTDEYMPVKVNGVDCSVVPTMDTADVAFDKVTKYAGAGINPTTKPKIDLEVCSDAINGTGYITGARPLSEANATQKAEIEKCSIHQVDYSQYYPESVLKKEIVDSDNDGMPDDWELARGLDPNNASDANGDYAGLGYTNIEYYLNDLTVDAFPEGVVTTSPTIKNSVVVNASANEVEGESYKTLTAAIKYMKDNADNMVAGRKTIYMTAGTYDENVTVDLSNLGIMLEENTTDKVIIKGINVLSSAEGFSIDGVQVGDGSGDALTIATDKATFDNCTFVGKDNSVVISNKARTYFKNCAFTGTVKATDDAKAVINKSALSDKVSIADSAISSGNKYGILIMGSTINSNGSAVLGSASSDYGQIIYADCKIINVASGRFADVTGKTDKIRFMEYKSRDSKGAAVDVSTLPAYVAALSEYDYYETYSPFKHLKEKFGSKADNWNPGSFSEVTPQEELQQLADSISVQKTIITKNTSLTSSFADNEDVKITWSSSDPSVFSDNEIIVGDYGSGVKYATLTAIISKDGLTSVTKTFDIIVGSLSESQDGVVDFEECEINGDSEDLKMTTNYTKNDKMTWGVVDNINGQDTGDHGKIYQVNQSAKTKVDASVDAGKGMYDFTYNFGKMSEKVVEVDFDAYIDELSTDGYFEAYLRGSNIIGQIRFTDDGILAYKDTKNTASLANDTGKWYTFKLFVNTVGISNGTAPTVDYYVYDETGKQVGSVVGASSKTAYDKATYQNFIPDRIAFRPNRSIDTCKFYIDNIQFKDLTSIAQEDAKSIAKKHTLKKGDRLPVYGNHLSNITWKTVDGQSDVVNADGTINYDKCGVTTINVRGTVTYGKNLKGTAETEDIVLVVNGTGTNQEVVSDKFFTDTDDFSGWFKEYNQSAVGIKLDDTTAVAGNSTAKVLLPNKAVFKKFNTPASTGKVTFTTDFCENSITGTTGRTFRIFLENNETADDGNGYGSAAFDSTNIFYHLTDIGGKTYVVTSDTPNANDTTATLTEVGTLEADKWYRVQVELDFDNKTAETSIFLHGTDGSYNTSNISSTPIGKVTTNLIAKTPLQLKQIRLVRTADANVYFDNVSVSGDLKVKGVTISEDSFNIKKGETHQLYAIVSPSDAPDKTVTWSSDKPEVAKVDENGLVTAVADGTAKITVTTTDGGYTGSCVVTVGEATPDNPVTFGDVNNDGKIDVNDASLTLNYVLDKNTTGVNSESIKNMKVMGNENVTAEDVSAILRKALDNNFKFVVEK